MLVSISDRREVMIQAVLDPNFRDLLRRKPHEAVRSATGRDVSDQRVEVIEEQPTAWEFVVPANLANQTLPDAFDARTEAENRVFALFQREPGAIQSACRNPAFFLADRLGIDPGEAAINVRVEQRGEILLVLAQGAEGAELDDEMLDLISAGGSPACNPPVGMDQKQAVRT